MGGNVARSLSDSSYFESDKSPFLRGNNFTTFLFLNIRSISANLDEYILESPFVRNVDFLCFAETRLCNSIENLYKLNNYNMFANSRNVRGGGVAVYASDKYNCNVIKEATIRTITTESIFLNCVSESYSFVLGCIYRPPSSDIGQFCSELDEILIYFRTHLPDSDLILVGDFNIDLFALGANVDCLKFVSQMYSFGLTPLILRPTRVGTASATLIDHIWTSNVAVAARSGVLLSHVTDHFPIFTQFAAVSPAATDGDEVYTHVCRRVKNFDSLTARLNTVDWNFVRDTESVNEAYNVFADRIEYIMRHVL